MCGLGFNPAAPAEARIRRRVARAPHLPPDVVDLLAHDDRVVRLFLTESCEVAPASLLLEVWSWWSASFSFPGRPHNHPNFPRHDLLRCAEDPDPRMRLLALDDPGLCAALVERSSRDPDARVRGRAASDPRLSSDSAVRPADDADHHVGFPYAADMCERVGGVGCRPIRQGLPARSEILHGSDCLAYLYCLTVLNFLAGLERRPVSPIALETDRFAAVHDDHGHIPSHFPEHRRNAAVPSTYGRR